MFAHTFSTYSFSSVNQANHCLSCRRRRRRRRSHNPKFYQPNSGANTQTTRVAGTSVACVLACMTDYNARHVTRPGPLPPKHQLCGTPPFAAGDVSLPNFAPELCTQLAEHHASARVVVVRLSATTRWRRTTHQHQVTQPLCSAAFVMLTSEKGQYANRFPGTRRSQHANRNVCLALMYDV